MHLCFNIMLIADHSGRRPLIQEDQTDHIRINSTWIKLCSETLIAERKCEGGERPSSVQYYISYLSVRITVLSLLLYYCLLFSADCAMKKSEEETTPSVPESSVQCGQVLAPFLQL